MKWEELNSKEKFKRSAQFGGLVALLNSPIVTWAVSAYADIKQEVQQNREKIIQMRERESAQKKNIERIDSNIQIIKSDIKQILIRGRG